MSRLCSPAGNSAGFHPACTVHLHEGPHSQHHHASPSSTTPKTVQQWPRMDTGRQTERTIRTRPHLWTSSVLQRSQICHGCRSVSRPSSSTNNEGARPLGQLLGATRAIAGSLLKVEQCESQYCRSRGPADTSVCVCVGGWLLEQLLSAVLCSFLLHMRSCCATALSCAHCIHLSDAQQSFSAGGSPVHVLRLSLRPWVTDTATHAHDSSFRLCLTHTASLATLIS